MKRPFEPPLGILASPTIDRVLVADCAVHGGAERCGGGGGCFTSLFSFGDFVCSPSSPPRRFPAPFSPPAVSLPLVLASGSGCVSGRTQGRTGPGCRAVAV